MSKNTAITIYPSNELRKLFSSFLNMANMFFCVFYDETKLIVLSEIEDFFLKTVEYSGVFFMLYNEVFFVLLFNKKVFL